LLLWPAHRLVRTHCEECVAEPAPASRLSSTRSCAPPSSMAPGAGSPSCSLVDKVVGVGHFMRQPTGE